ncbi:MAG: HAMP domain-containing sensor histidine kinase [bacterium]|nr:HAMP domain-containing sensor histidine kinase [bacterium]
MLKSTFEKGLEFTKRNPTIFYSLFLIIAVTGALFFNSYYSLQKFQATSDALLKSKAVLAENIFRILGSDILKNTARLQDKLDQIKEENSDVTNVAVFTRATDETPFIVAASTDHGVVGSVVEETALPYLIAWQDARIVPAFLTNESGKRYWNVIKKVTDADGRGLGLVLFQLSLEEHDAFVRKAILQVYGVAILSLIFVLLLLMNHMRFFRYALRVTKLEEVDRMKDDFISMASHELKTPLTVLRGYVDLLRDATVKPRAVEGEKQTTEYLESMDASIVRLDNLVEDILNVSRLEQNRLPIELQAVDIVVLLGALAKEFSLLAKNKGLTFRYEPQAVSSVTADPERLKQILVNLLGNAVKYTPAGKVELSAKETDDVVVVTVADTGLGISAPSLEHLFSKFYRIKTEQTAKISGSGLGLWISREIARKMGGDLTVESIEGVGSHFRLRLKKHPR